MARRIDRFDFTAGDVLLGKYRIISLLGAGWEGEVFRVRELSTGIERTVKFFYPQRNLGGRTSTFYAKKLHKLRHCPIMIQYHTRERILFQGIPVTFLVSDFVEGELLSRFLKQQPGGRLRAFEALHLLYSIASGLECIHHFGEYHGDLHDENIIIKRLGIGFEVKLLDMFHWGPPTAANTHRDVCDLIRIFYDILGGAKLYAKQPKEIKAICCGLKKTLILGKFRTAGHLREYLETMEWA